MPVNKLHRHRDGHGHGGMAMVMDLEVYRAPSPAAPRLAAAAAAGPRWHWQSRCQPERGINDSDDCWQVPAARVSPGQLESSLSMTRSESSVPGTVTATARSARDLPEWLWWQATSTLNPSRRHRADRRRRPGESAVAAAASS